MGRVCAGATEPVPDGTVFRKNASSVSPLLAISETLSQTPVIWPIFSSSVILPMRSSTLAWIGADGSR